jgi:hypothetical protein
MKFDALIDALVSATPSIVGGFVGGCFVLVGVRSQFRRQSKAALRALMAEVVGNKESAVDMTKSLSTTFLAGHADPSWLKHSIWDSQLPYVVQIFDEGTLRTVRYAYSLLDAVPAMYSASQSLWLRGGWIDAHLITIRIAFEDADRVLENLAKTRWQRVKALFGGWK